MTKVQRYEWEDRILKAERLGLIPAGSVNMALRLASAINWVPKGVRPSGLYWKNETALQAVGSSRATYFRNKGPLFEYGFFTEERGNLIPQLPDLSQYETEESQVETELSHIETEESQVDTPYTVNTYTDNTLTVDSLNEEAPLVPRDAQLPENKNDKDDQHEAILIGSNDLEPSLIGSTSSTPIAFNNTGRGAAGPVDRWKQKQGIKTVEWELPEWSKPGWEPPAKKVTVPADELEW